MMEPLSRVLRDYQVAVGLKDGYQVVLTGLHCVFVSPFPGLSLLDIMPFPLKLVKLSNSQLSVSQSVSGRQTTNINTHKHKHWLSSCLLGSFLALTTSLLVKYTLLGSFACELKPTLARCQILIRRSWVSVLVSSNVSSGREDDQ